MEKRSYVEVDQTIRKQLKILAAMRNTSSKALVEQALAAQHPEIDALVKKEA